jgi:hypothetical protein
MKLTIDNFDGAGPRDYTPAIDESHAPRVLRRLNKPAELRLSLLAASPDFVVPVNGARVILGRTNGTDVFTGYLAAAPDFEYLGWGERGPIYLYHLVAVSDELLLNRKTIPNRYPFVDRSAGDALRQLTEDLMPGAFDTGGVADIDTLIWYSVDSRKPWSDHAAAIATAARAAYRVVNSGITFEPVGSVIHEFDESNPDFSQEALKLRVEDRRINDLVVTGRTEPQAYVTDYFVGDGLSLRFYLSETPFTRSSRVLLDEEYRGNSPDRARWQVEDPASATTVNLGKLQVNGGTGAFGQTLVQFVEKIELGGALVLQHGDVTFNSPSDGILGGLYSGETSAIGCLAGFYIRSSGGASSIQALVSGVITGPALAVQTTHRYVLTTRLYASEIYRRRQMFHSSVHPAGAARGGGAVSADARIVLEVHDIDPANPGSLAAASTVLYDGVAANAPDFCTYALVNAADLHCALTFTRIIRAVDTEVRSALPGQVYRTRLTGALSEGAECRVLSEPALQFFPQHVPAANEQIIVRYRARGEAVARVIDKSGIATLEGSPDDGTRGAIREVNSPAPRTSIDCENAALALLDDSVESAWAGEYRTWSDLLPSGDIHPGDRVRVSAPSRDALFDAIVREVEVEIVDCRDEHSRYKLMFADEAAQPLAFDFDAGAGGASSAVVATNADAVGTNFAADLSSAQVAQISSTTVTIDAGVTPPAGGGIEVRSSDSAWSMENDRNLLGRFTSRTFTVPRLGRAQTYFLRQHDASTPAKYSRYSAALHIDFPL